MIGQKDKIIQFKNYLKKEKYSENTITSYLSDINKLFDWLSSNHLELDKNSIEKYFDFIKNSSSPKTIARNVNATRIFLNISKLDILNKSATNHLSIKQINKKPNFLSAEEVKILQNKFIGEPKIHTCITILLQTGIKISEICNLKVKDFINKSGKYFLYIKSDSREVPVNNKLLFVLKTYIAETKLKKDDFVLQNSVGKKYHIRNLRGILSKSFSSCDIKASVNDLRNTFIFQQLSAGNSLEYIQQIAGHKSKLATAKYLIYVKNYKDRDIKDVVEL